MTNYDDLLGDVPDYVRPEKTYRLVFEGGEEAGLVMITRRVTLGQMTVIAGLADFDPRAADAPQKVFDLCEAFGPALLAWNYKRETVDAKGKPKLEKVPATADGLRGCDFMFVQRVVVEWMRAVAGVDTPLGTPSQDGEQSVAESIPMDVL